MLMNVSNAPCVNFANWKVWLLSGADIFLFLLGNGRNLRLLFFQHEFGHKTSDAVLELAIFAGVDERVDATVDEHQYHGEVVEPADERDNLV